LEVIWKNLDIVKSSNMVKNRGLEAKNQTGTMHVKVSVPLLAIVVTIVSIGAFTLVIPAVSAQSTSTTSTGVANVSIVSGAKNEDNGLFFSPANITVVLGVNNTVVWTNHDSTNHTVVALDNSYSATLTPGQTYTHTYTTPGVYKYHCTIHLWMTGSVTVLAAPSSSSTSTSSSTGAVPEFPFVAFGVVFLTAIILVSYAAARKTSRHSLER